MKHILNNISEEEKNAIREQHTGGMKLNTEKFKNLIEAKQGDAKPLLSEQESINKTNAFGGLQNLPVSVFSNPEKTHELLSREDKTEIVSAEKDNNGNIHLQLKRMLHNSPTVWDITYSCSNKSLTLNLNGKQKVVYSDFTDLLDKKYCSSVKPTQYN